MDYACGLKNPPALIWTASYHFWTDKGLCGARRYFDALVVRAAAYYLNIRLITIRYIDQYGRSRAWPYFCMISFL